MAGLEPMRQLEVERKIRLISPIILYLCMLTRKWVSLIYCQKLEKTP